MILRDFPGTPEAQYWLVRHRLRSEFHLTVKEVNDELDNHADEVLLHLKIWELVNRRQENDSKKQENRARMNQSMKP